MKILAERGVVVVVLIDGLIAGRRGGASWSGCRLYLRVAWSVRLRVRISVMTISVHPGCRVRVFISDPFVLYVCHALTMIGVSRSFPIVLDQVDSFIVLEGVGQVKITLSIILI